MYTIVRLALELEVPVTPQLEDLRRGERILNALFVMLLNREHLYPDLFETTPDTPVMTAKRALLQPILAKYYRSMSPAQYHNEPEFLTTLQEYSQNVPTSKPGTVVSVLSHFSAFVSNKSNSSTGDEYFYSQRDNAIAELKILKELLNRYFSS